MTNVREAGEKLDGVERAEARVVMMRRAAIEATRTRTQVGPYITHSDGEKYAQRDDVARVLAGSWPGYASAIDAAITALVNEHLLHEIDYDGTRWLRVDAL